MALSQLLTYSSCRICGNELEGLALITRGQKSLFPHWPAFHPLFAITYTGVVMLGRSISVLCLYQSYCGQEYTQGCAQAHRWRMFPPAVLAWEAFWEVTLTAPQVTSEASKVLMVRNWTSVWGAIRYTPGASPPHLSGMTGRDEYSTCVSKGQIKSDQGRKASL